MSLYRIPRRWSIGTRKEYEIWMPQITQIGAEYTPKDKKTVAKKRAFENLKLGIGGDQPDFITSYISLNADKARYCKHFQKNHLCISLYLSTPFHTEMA